MHTKRRTRNDAHKTTRQLPSKSKFLLVGVRSHLSLFSFSASRQLRMFDVSNLLCSVLFPSDSYIRLSSYNPMTSVLVFLLFFSPFNIFLASSLLLACVQSIFCVLL